MRNELQMEVVLLPKSAVLIRPPRLWGQPCSDIFVEHADLAMNELKPVQSSSPVKTSRQNSTFTNQDGP